MCQRRDRPAPVARAPEFLPVERVRSAGPTVSLLPAALHLDFSPALEAATFERSVFAPVGRVSIFPRLQSVLLRLKTAESVCLWPISLSELELLSRRLFPFWAKLGPMAVA